MPSSVLKKFVGIIRRENRTAKYATISALMALTAPPVMAECLPLEDSIVPLEIKKNALKIGNYSEFVEFTGLLSGNTDDADFVSSLKGAFPESFVFCETLMSERISPKMAQELIVFEAPGDQLVYLYWLAAEIKGSWSILHYSLTTTFLEISDSWK